MTNSITIENAANELNLTIDELRDLLHGYYKNPAKVKALSMQKWERIKEKYQQLSIENNEQFTEEIQADVETQATEENDFFQSSPTQSFTPSETEQPIESITTPIQPETTSNQPEPMNDNNLEQVELQRQQDIENALKSTFEQGSELGQLIEESYWIGAAAGRVKSRNSERVQRLQQAVLNPGFTKASSANVLQNYLESRGFFGMLPQSSEAPKLLTD